MIIHQAIYGDKSGSYALIKTTLDDIELAKRLCNVTDLLDRPSDNRLDQPVIRGFPSHGHYLFIKSFLDDATSVRKGRVLSHTLIVELCDLPKIVDLALILDTLIPKLEKDPELAPITIEDKCRTAPEIIATTSREAAAINGLMNGSNNNTLVWIGQEGYIPFITKLWPGLGANLRSNLRFGAGFGPDHVDKTHLNILYILEEYERKWQSRGFCLIRKQDVATLESMSSFLLAGHEDKSHPLRGLIDNFKIVPTQIGDYLYLEKVLPTYENLSSVTEFNLLLVFCDLISKYSPHHDTAQDEKRKVIGRVTSLIEVADADSILMLKNPNWDGFSNAQHLIAGKISEWVQNTLSGSVRKGDITSVIAASFSEDDSGEWWKKAISDGLTVAFHDWKREYASVVWNWFRDNNNLVGALKSYVPEASQVEIDFVDNWIPPTTRQLAEMVQNFSRDRNWFVLHALSTVHLYKPGESLKIQLEIDTDSNHLAALQKMSEFISDREFIQLTVGIGEVRLLKIAGRKIINEPQLMEMIDVANIVWQKLWFEVTTKNGDPWLGISNPSETLTKLLDLLVSGNPVIQDLVTSLAKTSVSNLSSYWNRKGVWSCLPRVAEKYFINSTVSGLLESAEDDHGCLVGLEPELVLAIEKRLSKGKLLRDNQTSVKVKLRLLDLFAVKEGVFIDFFRENTTEFSKSEAEALGNLISEKKWVESARNVKNKKYSYRNLEHAWKRCGHLVPHSWWETDRVKSETVISHTDSYKVDKTKILVLAASPTDQSQLNLSKEVREIEDQLEAAKYRDNFEVTSKVAAKFNTFTKAILDVSPQIVHFSGHGDVSGIVLEHDDGSTHFVDKEALNFIFHLLEDQVKCVLLNACYSEEQAKAISEHGIYVVGMSDSIEDAAAIAFSTGFYQSIGAGRDFQFSHEWGLAHIKGKASSNQKHVPVLWLNGKKIQTLT